MKHHVWCNYVNPFAPLGSPLHPDSGGEDCVMCKGLQAEFPDCNLMTEEEMQRKYFPNNVRVDK